MRQIGKRELRKTEIAELLEVNRRTVAVWLESGRLRDATFASVLAFVEERAQRRYRDKLIDFIRGDGV